MGKGTPRLRWEFGDAVLWVSFGDDKPFPVSVRRTRNGIAHDSHPHRELTADEFEALEDFLTQRAQDLAASWPEGFETRLNWSEETLGRTGRSSRKKKG